MRCCGWRGVRQKRLALQVEWRRPRGGANVKGLKTVCLGVFPSRWVQSIGVLSLKRQKRYETLYEKGQKGAFLSPRWCHVTSQAGFRPFGKPTFRTVISSPELREEAEALLRGNCAKWPAVDRGRSGSDVSKRESWWFPFTRWMMGAFPNKTILGGWQLAKGSVRPWCGWAWRCKQRCSGRHRFCTVSTGFRNPLGQNNLKLAAQWNRTTTTFWKKVLHPNCQGIDSEKESPPSKIFVFEKAKEAYLLWAVVAGGEDQKLFRFRELVVFCFQAPQNHTCGWLLPHESPCLKPIKSGRGRLSRNHQFHQETIRTWPVDPPCLENQGLRSKETKIVSSWSCWMTHPSMAVSLAPNATLQADPSIGRKEGQRDLFFEGLVINLFFGWRQWWFLGWFTYFFRFWGLSSRGYEASVLSSSCGLNGFVGSTMKQPKHTVPNSAKVFLLVFWGLLCFSSSFVCSTSLFFYPVDFAFLLPPFSDLKSQPSEPVQLAAGR